ncbi:MAG TPA: TetR/AcrR family transcriptional regulator [Bryobacteraceae bacterium]|nr:TetR/AcrR family transcriptional regulator [Bryobacteraceae bacterium]
MPRAFTEVERQVLTRKLRQAGSNAIARYGLRKLNVEDVAREAGISKGAFYLFFPSKEALVVDILGTIETTMRQELEARLNEPATSAREVIVRFLRHLFDVVEREPVLAVLTNPEEAGYLFRAVPPEELARRKLDDDRYFEALFARWQNEGVLEPIDVHVLSGLPSMVLALAQQKEMIGRDRFPALMDLLIESLAHRLAPRKKGR